MQVRFAIALFSVMLTPPALSEDAPSNGASNTATEAVEEVVVTAGFRPAPLMSRSGSASVIAAETIDQRGARHVEDIVAITPNVNFAAGGSRARFFQIRGIGDLEQFVDPKHFPSVGIVVDGIELSNVATSALLFDTEQVEVLRGPQGTRFGASALGGIINIRGSEATAEREGELSGGYGNLDSWQTTGILSGGLSDTLRGRIAIRQYESDGFIRNAFLRRDTMGINELTARGKLSWEPRSDLRLDLTGIYIDADNGYDAFSLDNSRTTLSDQPGSDDQAIGAFGATLNWDIGDIGTLQFRSTVTDADEIYEFDEDWVFSGFCDGVRCAPALEFSSADSFDRQRTQYTGEVRWLGERGAASWVTGAYLHRRDESLQRTRFGLFTSDYETERYAVFGELEFPLHDTVLARFGARGESFEDEYTDSNLLDVSTDSIYWSAEATLEWAPRDDTLLYATVARGAKPGGTNTDTNSSFPVVAPRFTGFLGDRLTFDTETVLNKEIGIKGRYFDERLNLQVSAFHVDRNDAQLEAFIFDPVTFLFVGYLDNAESAQNYGLEFESTTVLTERLSLLATLGYLETNVDSLTVFDLALDDFRQLNDRDQAKAPTWQYHVGARWRIRSDLVSNVSVEGRDSSFFGYYHDGTLDAYTSVNANLTWQPGPAEVRLWARNLLDEDYAVHGLFFANDPRNAFSVNQTYIQNALPRVYGVDLSWRF